MARGAGRCPAPPPCPPPARWCHVGAWSCRGLRCVRERPAPGWAAAAGRPPSLPSSWTPTSLGHGGQGHFSVPSTSASTWVSPDTVGRQWHRPSRALRPEACHAPPPASPEALVPSCGSALRLSAQRPRPTRRSSQLHLQSADPVPWPPIPKCFACVGLPDPAAGPPCDLITRCPTFPGASGCLPERCGEAEGPGVPPAASGKRDGDSATSLAQPGACSRTRRVLSRHLVPLGTAEQGHREARCGLQPLPGPRTPTLHFLG